MTTACIELKAKFGRGTVDGYNVAFELADLPKSGKAVEAEAAETAIARTPGEDGCGRG